MSTLARDWTADQLRDRVAAALTPPPSLRLGSSAPAAKGQSLVQAVAALEAQVGPLGAHRTYFQWGDWAMAAVVLADDAAHGRTSVISIKPPLSPGTTDGAREVATGTHDVDLAQWAVLLVQYPDAIVIWWHEPEDDPGVTPAIFLGFLEHCIDFMRSRGVTALQAQCLMAWTTVPRSGRQVSLWLSAKVDVMLWDGYDGPMAQVFAVPLALTRAHGKPFGVAEWGVKSSGTAQADALVASAAWFRAQTDIPVVTFWDSGAYVLDAGALAALKVLLAD